MTTVIPLVLQLLPVIPSLVENVIKVVEVVRRDPQTPTAAKADLDDLNRRLHDIAERVKAVRLPA